MRAKPYPLEALRTARTEAFYLAQAALHDARVALTTAQAKLASAERDQASLLEQRQQVSRPGMVRATELARAGAFSIRLRVAYEAQLTQVSAAKSEARRCERAVRLAELTLHQAYIERELVERHHAEFALEARKKELRAIEDEEDEWRTFQHFWGNKKRRR